MLEIKNEHIVFGDSEKYCCLKCFFFFQIMMSVR